MPVKRTIRKDEHGLEPGTYNPAELAARLAGEKPILEPPKGAKRPDAREVPVDEMPDNFFDPRLGPPADDSQGIAAAVEASLNPKEELAEEESESAEEEEEATEEEEASEESEEEAEDELEAEDASEEEESSEKKGKSRSQRRKEQLAREREARLAAEKELEVFRRLSPQIQFLLSDPELAQAARNRMAGKPIHEAESSAERFKIPEKPKPPVRPTNFSRERAIDDPQSPDAKYLDERDEYPIRLEAWRESKEQVETQKASYLAQQNKVRQQKQAQQQWWGNLIQGLTEAAQNDPNISADEVEQRVQEALKVLGDSEAYSPTTLWQFSQNYLGRKRAVGKAKAAPTSKPALKKKAPPTPAAVSSSADVTKMPKGWVGGEGEWWGGEDFKRV